MTISRYHKLFILSALTCVVPVSDAYSGPVMTRIWGMVSNYFSNKKPKFTHPFGEFPPGQRTDWLSTTNNSPQSVSGSNDSASSGIFSTKNMLIGSAVAAVAVAGYKLWDWYTARKEREKARERARKAKHAAAERALNRVLKAERQQREENEREALAEESRVLKEEESRKMKANAKEEHRALKAEQRLRNLARREKERDAKKIDAMFDYLDDATQAAKDEENFETTCAELGNLTQAFDDEGQVGCDTQSFLSERVKHCSLCNALTVTYLNALCEDEGTENKEHVVTFLRNRDERLWNNREIMPLISKDNPSFVIGRLEYIAKGEQYVAAVISGRANHVPQRNQKEYLDSLISITWYLYAKALEKGDGFSKSGSFNIQSKELMNFFMGYYHKVREWHGEFCKTGRSWVACYAKCGTNKLGDHPFAYERCSSHLKGLHAPNYGIDIRFMSDAEGTSWFDSAHSWLGYATQSMYDFFGQAPQVITNTLTERRDTRSEDVAELQQMDDALPAMKEHLQRNEALTNQLSHIQSVCTLLPDGKAHLLFIPYNTEHGCFLLKPERHGTTVFDLADATAHGLEFLHGSKDADYEYTRREKMKKDGKFKELQERYKQHVPGQGFHEKSSETDTLVRKSTDNTKQISTFGCQYMLEQLNHWLGKNLGRYTREQLELLKADLLGLYTDHHDIRFAHEVVFKETDFR